jgi:hypothetical protein
MSELSRANRAQAQLSRHINELRRQLGACEQRLKEAKTEMRDIKGQLLIAPQDLSPESVHSVADHIFLDIARNREKPANHRSYSTETLVWGRKIYDISPAAWEAMRDVLPLPSDRLLRLRFSECRALIADALLNVSQMWHLIQLGNRRIPEP